MLRPIEQLSMIFHYREAALYGKRVLFPKVESKLSPDGTEITDEFVRGLFEKMLDGFADFSRKLKAE